MRKLIIGFILGIILCSGVVYGSNVYQSNAIEYSPTDSSWEVSNVSDAINSLYDMKKELDNIKSLGDATAAQILSGKKAVVKGNTVTGTMANRGAVTSTLNAGGSYTIPAGYHNGSGKVSCSNTNLKPIIKNIEYKYYTHAEWVSGRRTETLTLTIEPNGANSITLNLNEEKPTGSYSTAGSAIITNVTNGTFSGTTVIPENNNSDVIVTVSVTCGTVTYSGATFTRHLGIESFT